MVESALGSTTVKKGRGKAASASAGDEDGGLPPLSDAESEPDEEADIDVSKFQKKARGGRATKAAGSTTGAKRKAPARGGAGAKAAPKKRKS